MEVVAPNIFENLKNLQNKYDLYEPHGSNGLYHITIKGNFKPICNCNALYYEAVGGDVVGIDDKYLYFEEPLYDERLSINLNKYFKWQICKHCFKKIINQLNNNCLKHK